MKTNRRGILLGGAGTAVLGPQAARLAAAQAPAANPSLAEQQAMADHNMEAMSKVLGPGLWGQEQVAMLIYPGFTALDLVGPHYFFACMFGAKVHLVTTEPELAPVRSDLGLAIMPTVTMDAAPAAPDLLFVPGGTDGTLAVMGRADAMDWVRARAARARFVTSVCTGAMILAKAGLLRGRRATSHWATRPALPAFGAIPVDARIVRDGNVLTAAGVTAGMDFAIAVVEMLRGRAYAEALVLQAEYAPDPPVTGGSLATASAPVGEMMGSMFGPIADRFRAMAGN